MAHDFHTSVMPPEKKAPLMRYPVHEHMVSYLHKDAIKQAFGFDMEISDHPVDGKAVPKVFGEEFVAHAGVGSPLKDSNAKKKLAQHAFPRMTAAMLDERDPGGEVRGWMRRLGEMLA